MRKTDVAMLICGLALLAGDAAARLVTGCEEPLPHFQCYEVKPGRFTTAPPTVVDRFGPLTPDLRFPHRLCAPTNKNGEDPNAPANPQHLAGYGVRASAPRQTGLVVTNQFGSLTLDTTRPDYLMVPTAKGLNGPPPPLGPPLVDHFSCYKVKRSRGAPKFVKQLGVSVVDQLESVSLDVVKPARLCVPANKNDEDPTAPTHPQALLCYKTRSRIGYDGRVVDTLNQFGPDTMELIHRRELCVPSFINGESCGTTTTTSSTTTSTTQTSTTIEGPSTTTTSSTSTSSTSTSTTTTSSTSTTLAPVKVAGVRYRSLGNTGADEIYLGVGDLGVAANRTAEQVTWAKPGTYDFTFSYDPGVPELRTTVKGVDNAVDETVVRALPGPLAAMDSFEIGVCDRVAGSQVDLLNVTVDGQPVGGISVVGNDDPTNCQFPKFTAAGLGIDLNDGFTFTGQLFLDGPFSSSQELTRAEIIVGQNFLP
jgi:hypothetical protein